MPRMEFSSYSYLCFQTLYSIVWANIRNRERRKIQIVEFIKWLNRGGNIRRRARIITYIDMKKMKPQLIPYRPMI